MSGNGHNGTLHNGVTWISQGFINSAVNVDGTTDTRIELGTWNPAEGTGQLSLALWIRWAGGGPQYQGLVGKRDTWPGTTMFQFQVRPENDGTFRLETGTYAVVSPNGTLAPFVQTWAHVAATFDGTTCRLYLNGQQIQSGPFALNAAGETSNMGMGCVTGGGAGYSGNGEVFLGDIDEVYIYNRALSEAEILGVMEGGAGFPFAFGPTPEDGALLIDFPGGILGTSLSWKAGDFAVSHDVYFGENLDDVRDGAGGTFCGNQTETIFLVGYGFTQNDPAPTGLVRGATYYWRIDEVNDTEPDSPWKGNVWSFSIPNTKAYAPSPPDGSRFMDLNTDVSWEKGLGAITQTVYFGDDYDTVSNTTTGGKPVAGATTYDPGPLEYNKVYYWRVDSTGVYGQITGDVWSFTTISPYAGVRAEYYHWTSATIPPPRSVAFGTRVLTRIESQIDHHWGSGSPDPLVNIDQFAGRWTAELEAALSEPHTFWTLTDDGLRVWLDGELIIDNWTDHGDTWDSSQPIDLVAGQRYALVMEWFENAGGATAELDWASPSMPRQVIPAGPLQLPLRASSPDPPNGATGVEETPTLKWKAGEQAAQHDVFFGTDRDAVANADTTTPVIYRGRQDPDSYTTETLEWDQTYYWRIDEVNTLDAEGLWKGSVWSFTVANYLIVDDFEPYDDFCNRIFYTWGDGWGHNGDVSCGVPPYGGNGTGSTVGYLAEPYAEQTITHDASFQSMPFEYLNDGSTGKALYSETERTFDPPQNWARHGVHDLKALTLWFRGNPGSVGSFSYNPVSDIYTMTANGADIWDVPDFPGAGAGNYHDEFHYAYKRLSGQGAILARVLSVSNTNGWAKAGVMIRETLDANSVHAMMVVTPSQGVSFQRRTTAADNSQLTTEAGIQAPHWVRLIRSGNTFTAAHSTDGSAWETLGSPQTVTMAPNVYVGLALTSHNVNRTCEARFSDVTIAGTVTGQWQSQDIGISSNDAEQLYVAVEDSTGKSKAVSHPDPCAVQLSTWQQWNIDLEAFSDAGVNLQSVNKMYIGVGDRDAPNLGGAGMLYVDDIRLYQSRCLPSLAKPVGDFDNNCVVDYPDLDIMTNNWLISDYDVTPEDPGTGNLVAYYALENNTNDGSGRAHHGDPCGAPTYVTGPTGYGTAIHFDGRGQGNYVDLGTFNPSAPTGELTVAVWAKWDGLSDYWQGLVAKRDSWNADDMMWQLEADIYTGTLGFFRYGGPYFANGALPVGQWTHVAASFDGTNVSFYINAEMTGSGPFSFGPDTEARVVFGAVEGNGGNPFNGALDEVRIYDRGLTQGQIARLAGKTATYTQPLYLLLTPQDGTIDMNSDGTIDLKDYAVLVDRWLDEVLWP